MKVTNIAADANVLFKNCAPFTRCVTQINDEHVETAENLHIIILCTISLNIVTIIVTHLEVYISLKEIDLQ